MTDTEKWIHENVSYLLMNASDVFYWASADVVQINVPEGLEVAVEARKKFGKEGNFAVMAMIRGQEPQRPWFDRGILSADRYRRAKEWLKEQDEEVGFVSEAQESNEEQAKRDRILADQAQRIRELEAEVRGLA